METRAESIVIKYASSGTSDTSTIKVYGKEIYYGVSEHTVTSTQADYLRYQLGGYQCGISYSVSGGYAYAIYPYTLSYYTTAAQEKKVTQSVNQLISDLELEYISSEYGIIKLAYDYITENVTYDDTHLKDETYKLKNIAYAALINKTAVCQSFSALLYRILNTCGADCRINSGDADGNHA